MDKENKWQCLKGQKEELGIFYYLYSVWKVVMLFEGRIKLVKTYTGNSKTTTKIIFKRSIIHLLREGIKCSVKTWENIKVEGNAKNIK